MNSYYPTSDAANIHIHVFIWRLNVMHFCLFFNFLLHLYFEAVVEMCRIFLSPSNLSIWHKAKWLTFIIFPALRALHLKLKYWMLQANKFPLFDNLRGNLRLGAFTIVSCLAERFVIRFEKKKNIEVRKIIHFIKKLSSFTISIQKISRHKRNCILTCINFPFSVLTCLKRIYAVELKFNKRTVKKNFFSLRSIRLW